MFLHFRTQGPDADRDRPPPYNILKGELASIVFVLVRDNQRVLPVGPLELARRAVSVEPELRGRPSLVSRERSQVLVCGNVLLRSRLLRPRRSGSLFHQILHPLGERDHRGAGALCALERLHRLGKREEGEAQKGKTLPVSRSQARECVSSTSFTFVNKQTRE